MGTSTSSQLQFFQKLSKSSENFEPLQLAVRTACGRLEETSCRIYATFAFLEYSIKRSP
eukprot:m.206624 g.206624  ORF g.206624 m.206624 type:complete len:59 (-) comp25359_c2_seq4:3829-4005(-)